VTVKRLGFVSNSSSSSFVIFYRDATLDEIDDEHVRVIGEGLNEGADYFHGDDRVRDYLKHHPEFFDEYYRLLYVYKVIDESGTLDPKELDGVVHVESIQVDYCSSNDWDDFEGRYLPGGFRY
jgi:hypothetical protein